MTVSSPEGTAGLEALAQSRPDLAKRISWVVVGLARVQPRIAEPRPSSVEQAAGALRSLPVLDESDVRQISDDPAELSWLAHRALDRSLVGNTATFTVMNTVIKLALALGQRFEPIPIKLIDFFDRARDLRLYDVPEQIAWLAGHRGADALVTGLTGVIEDDPERTLDFLDAVIGAYGSFPLPGGPPAQDSATSPSRDLPVIPSEPLTPAPVTAEPPPPPPPSPPMSAPGRSVWRKGRIRDFLRKARAPFGSGRARRPQARPRESRPARPPRDVPAVVSTGFCERRGGHPLPPDRTLGADLRYHFFVQIAPDLVPGAIDSGAKPLPLLAAGTVLQVVLFGFDGELQPVTGMDVGELRLIGAGAAIVERQPGGEPGQARLYLPVDTPLTAGTHRMRCNIYHRQALLQSRVIEARVTAEPGQKQDGALRSTLDFAISSDLDPEHLEALQPRTLSVLVNDNGNGTHGFKFFGAGEFKRDVTLTGETLTQQLEQARKGLRLASWDSEAEPTRAGFANLAYRYANPSREVLLEDLAVLARSGFKVWDVLVNQLSGGDDLALANRMKAPGRVEIANKQSLDLLVPAACIYDYPLDIEETDLTICTAFVAALGDQPLASLPCFNGRCPSYEDPRVVCPAGFWGFRHQIGYSASLVGGEPGDAHNFALTVGGTPALFIAGASADAGLRERDDHLRRLALMAGDRWNLAMTRTDLFKLFRDTAPTVVYLYGHGGSDGGSPYFEVGSGTDGPIIRASLGGKANWATTRPLVFLNGCHSAALSPSAAFSYATGFLQTAHAAAVVGTEIAVFESLAVRFAEECLRRFVVDRQPLGEAVLGTRIALLEEGIPLALAYLAFGPVDVRLVG